MFRGLLKTTRSHSFFLFGARGTSKTTCIRDAFEIDDALRWGTLPEIYSLRGNEDPEAYLRASASSETAPRRSMEVTRALAVSSACFAA